MRRFRLLLRALVVSATVAAISATPVIRAFAANSVPATQSISAPSRSGSTFFTYHHLHRTKQTFVVVAPSSSLCLPAEASPRRTVIVRERSALLAPFIGRADRPPV
jgi:hypothetical protein